MINPAKSPSVVVGVDGTESSRSALAWARRHASQLARVVPIIAFMPGPFAAGFGTVAGSDPDGDPYRSEAGAQVRNMVGDVDPSLTANACVIQGRAGPSLVRAARTAELLVLGSPRQIGHRPVLGSTARYCVRHCEAPVALIPEGAAIDTQLRNIVVGMNGSRNSRAALRWAIDNVEQSGTVVAVGVASPGVLDDGDLDRAEAAMVSKLDGWVNDEIRLGPLWLGEPSVSTEVRCGDARRELRAAAHDADALVVGARGDRSISRLLLGSVTNSMTRHPTVPTVVVHDRV